MINLLCYMNSFCSCNFIVAIFNGSTFQRFFSKPIVGVFCWSFLQCISLKVWCTAPFLLTSLASLRKYSSFVIVNAINEEKSEKKNKNKNKEKKVQRKRNYFKGARREEIIELRWHMCSTCCWNAMNSFPLGLRLAFCIQILAYFDEFYQQIHVCSSLTRYFDGNLKKQSVFVK